MSVPDFFMATTESKTFEDPRACFVLGNVASAEHPEMLWIRIDPVAIYSEPDSFWTTDLEEVLVTPRHRGDWIPPTDRWPCYVFVGRILKPFGDRKVLTADEYHMFAWAELYRTLEGAKAKLMSE